MKSKRPVFKSFRKKILYKPSADVLQPNIRHGETLIPIGATPTVVSLPKTLRTYTYDIINTDRLTSDLIVATTEGTLKGLILNTDQGGGTLNIAPVAVGTRQLKFNSTIKDGSFISTLSDGSDWFIWSFGIGQGLGQSTTKRQIRSLPSAGLIGGSIGTVFNSVAPPPSFEDVVITNTNVSVDFSNGPAEHDLSFTGSAHPSTVANPVTIKVFTPGPTLVTTVDVASDGSWNFSVDDLGNGSHTYTFEAFVGGVSIKKNDVYSELLDGGSLEFDCPTIEIEVGTSGPDFTTFPTVQHVDANGVITSKTVTVNSTTYADTQAEGDTFNVVFEYVHDTVTYQRTVDGVVVNLVQPAEPTISTVGGNASNVAISTPIADIVGTANPNATVQVWIDGIPNQAIGTATADGTGEWTISSHDFGFSMNQTVIIKAQQQTYRGSLWSNSSIADFLVKYEQNVLSEPTIASMEAGVYTFSNGDYTNQSNSFTINGTGVAGSEITLNGATPLSSPTTVAGDGTWTATTNLSHDETHDITAYATKAGFTTSQQSTAFQLNVDRTAPSFEPIYDTILYLGNVNDTLPVANDSFDPSGVTVTPSYSPSLANAEGYYVASYTATDRAGNSTTASSARTITVTTEPIVPVITSVTPNSDGTFTVVGTVTGTYADNLTVQVTIDGSNSGSPESVTGGIFTHNTSAKSPATYEFKAKSINTASQQSTLSSPVSEEISIPDTTPPVITITNTDTGGGLSHGDTVNLVDGDAFNFTVSAEGFPVTVAQGGSPVSSGTTFTTGTYSITFDASDDAIPPNAASTITITLEVVAAANFIEDIQSVIDRAASTAGYSINSGILTDNNGGNNSTALPIRLASPTQIAGSDDIVAYDTGTGETVNDEFTISWWMNMSTTQGSGRYNVFGRGGSEQFGLIVDVNTSGAINTVRLMYSNGSTTQTRNRLSSDFGTPIPAQGSWVHLAIVIYNDVSDMKIKLYLNGNHIVLNQGGSWGAQGVNPALGTKLLPSLSSNATIGFGGSPGGMLTFNTATAKGDFDSIQIGDGIVLSDDQILWISQDSLRQRSIAGAMAAVNSPPTISLNGSSSLFHPLGQSFSDPGATAQDQTDGDLTSSIQTTIVDSLGASISEINATTPAETYTITYSITDSGGETATTTRTVLVSAVITSANLLATQTVTLNGSTTLTNGILDLPGATSDYATIAGSSDYDPSGGITYSAWVNLDTLKTQQGILSNIFSDTGWDGISMQFLTSGTYPNGYVRVACNHDSNDKQINDVPIDSLGNPVSITTGTWHFLAVTFNPTGGECIAYFNGVALSQTLSGASIEHNNSWPFYIGAQRDSSTAYTVDGEIQGVRIEQTIKNASQLLAAYNEGPQ